MLSQIVRKGDYFSRFLDTNGDGSGTKNAIGNFAAAATDFFITPAHGTQINVARLIVQIVDVGNLTPATYGNLAALTNGISVLHLQGSTILDDYTDGIPVMTNGNWSRTSYDVNFNLSGGAGENYIDCRWSFNKASVEGILLMDFGQALAVRLNDDFTGLVSHTFCVQGEIFS